MPPAIAQKQNSKNISQPQPPPPSRFAWLANFKMPALCLFAGGVLGLSAPGINLWCIAWCGLAPLLILVALSKSAWQAAWRGWLFGTAYNLVYANWLLGLYPLDWLGFKDWQGILLAAAAWIICSCHQGLLIALFAGLCRLIPMKGSVLPERDKTRWLAPALLAVPLLWIIITNKIGNAHFFLGVPWTMLEYSQYQQLPIIQICSIIGGIGLGFLIVLVNTAIAIAVCTSKFKKGATIFSADNKWQAANQLLVLALVTTSCILFGFWQLAKRHVPPAANVSVLQGNINIEMQKTLHRYTLAELLNHYLTMAKHCPPGLCIWTESALPTYLSKEPAVLASLSDLARQKHLDLIVGAMDADSRSHAYNSAYGITSAGYVCRQVYHKRYLVPFGEYTPNVVRSFPEWILRLTNTPAGGGFAAGRDPVVLDLNSGKVAPLICFETLSPELVASSVRKGAQLIVNVTDLAWFHKSIAGDQMIAFSALRAVENNRYFVFAANTGPSAIIDSQGRVLQRSRLGRDRLLVGQVGFAKAITPFTNWFVF